MQNSGTRQLNFLSETLMLKQMIEDDMCNHSTFKTNIKDDKSQGHSKIMSVSSNFSFEK